MNISASAIGIWQRSSQDEQAPFVRNQAMMHEWGFWCDKKEIPATSSPQKRILLLGESVARGFFLDPGFTTAQVLQQLMNEASPEAFEVVDLARTNITATQLLQLFRECVVLKPEVVIVFAGNNWIFEVLNMISPEDIPHISREVAANGPVALKRLLEQKMAARVQSLLKEMRAVATENNIKLFFIIPEFNLAHWRQAHNTISVCTLSPEALDSWRKTCRDEIKARKDGDHATLKALGDQLIGLDPVNPHGYRVAANALSEIGLFAEAKEYYRRELDCSIIFKYILKPKITPAIQEAIATTCFKLGIDIIDSRPIFSGEGNGIPGREVFLDYCHLSVRGIQLTMAHTCGVLLKNLTGAEADMVQLKQKAFSITAPASLHGLAHMMAAIHHAHHDQEYDMIQYHCRQAITLNPDLAAFIRLYTEMAVLKAPNLVCKQYVEILKLVQKSRNQSELLHAPGKKLADFELVDAMLSVLGTEEGEQRKKIRGLLNRQHGVNAYGHINLLESYYSASGHRFCLVDLLQPVHYFREVEKSSRFRLVAQPGVETQLKLVCRVPQAVNGKIRIVVNDTALQSITATESWTTANIDLPARLLDREINIIDIHWPLVSRKASFRQLNSMNDLVLLINPVLGEIHQFTATAGKTASPLAAREEKLALHNG